MKYGRMYTTNLQKEYTPQYVTAQVGQFPSHIQNAEGTNEKVGM